MVPLVPRNLLYGSIKWLDEIYYQTYNLLH
jgi:hypothetical protein